MAIGWFFLTSLVLLHFLELQPLPDRKTDWNCLPKASLCGYASSDFVSENILPIYQLHQRARRIRHIASTPRGRKNHTSRSRYYANQDSSFHQTRLFTSGDVSLNPGALTTSGPNSTQNQKESFNCGLSCVSPHVRESSTFLDSGFHAVDSGFRVLDSGFQHSGFRIPKRAGFQFFTVLMLFFAFRFRVRILLY